MLLVLASASPYRAKQLEQLTYKFQCEPSYVDEDKFKETYSNPEELCSVLAFEKAKAVQKKFKNSTIIGADQLLFLEDPEGFEGKIFGKPHTPQKALEQLLKCNGKKQKLITSLCVLTPHNKYEHTDITILYMRKLSDQQLKAYIQADQPLECAGSIQLEKTGLTLFHKIESQDHSSLIGLPLIALCNILFKNKILPESLKI